MCDHLLSGNFVKLWRLIFWDSNKWRSKWCFVTQWTFRRTCISECHHEFLFTHSRRVSYLDNRGLLFFFSKIYSKISNLLHCVHFILSTRSIESGASSQLNVDEFVLSSSCSPFVSIDTRPKNCYQHKRAKREANGEANSEQTVLFFIKKNRRRFKGDKIFVQFGVSASSFIPSIFERYTFSSM